MWTWTKYQLDWRSLRQARKAIPAVTCSLPLGYCQNLGELVPVQWGIISSSLFCSRRIQYYWWYRGMAVRQNREDLTIKMKRHSMYSAWLLVVLITGWRQCFVNHSINWASFDHEMVITMAFFLTKTVIYFEFDILAVQ